ncbi:hypothetical protein A3J19_04070, partial [Candidatus Daviesbacteria bacterium RIFCSPLOWO2_02_FULL_41_8]
MDNQDELFVVVDKSDKIIGYRTRYDCHHNKQLIHRTIGVVIFNDKEEILLQKRSKNKDTNPSLYTLAVAGHVDKGETYKQTAQRELLEELGISSPLFKKKKFIVKTDIETEMNCIFTATYNGPFSPNKQETDGVKFVTIN